MQITITETGPESCALVEKSPSTSNEFRVPIPKTTLVNALRAVLADPEKREIGAGAVLIERRRDGLQVHAGSGAFLVKYQNLYPIVLES